jgi:hypothetical protein
MSEPFGACPRNCFFIHHLAGLWDVADGTLGDRPTRALINKEINIYAGRPPAGFLGSLMAHIGSRKPHSPGCRHPISIAQQEEKKTISRPSDRWLRPFSSGT